MDTLNTALWTHTKLTIEGETHLKELKIKLYIKVCVCVESKK